MRLQIDPQRQPEGFRKRIAPLSKVFHHTKTKKPAKRSSDQASLKIREDTFCFE